MTSPSDALEAMYATGHWLLGQRRAHHAADVFRLMVQIGSHDERAWLGLGAAHEALGQDAIAAELYRLAIAVGPFGRCALARARVLARAADASSEAAFEAALDAARELGDTELEAQVLADRGALS